VIPGFNSREIFQADPRIVATGLKVKPGRLRLGYQVVLSHPKLTKAIASARLKSDTVDASFVRLKVIQT
jgi:hypothetical protein